MRTRLLSTTTTDLKIAADLLMRGEVVVFPTDTVYGIGVSAFSAEAIDKLYAAKERAYSKGIPILLADEADLHKVVASEPVPAVKELIGRFWPGELTLIMPAHPNLPTNLSPNDNVAVRIPASDVARALIRRAGGAVATSSANISGQPAATTAIEAYQQLLGRVAAIVDAGHSPLAQASTILDCTLSPPKIVRSGPISADQLTEVVA